MLKLIGIVIACSCTILASICHRLIRCWGVEANIALIVFSFRGMLCNNVYYISHDHFIANVAIKIKTIHSEKWSYVRHAHVYLLMEKKQV